MLFYFVTFETEQLHIFLKASEQKNEVSKSRNHFQRSIEEKLKYST